jgi:putative nucleotidyltransferase with HDIG domain
VTGRPSRNIVVAHVVALCGAVAVGTATVGRADWDPAIFAVLLVFALLSDAMGSVVAAASRPHGPSTNLKISGSFLALVLAMVILGGTPAAIIGVATIIAGWLYRRREGALHFVLNDVVAYAWFPLLGGLLFDVVSDATGLSSSDGFFYVLVFAIFGFALALNFLVVAGYGGYIEGESLVTKARKSLVPILPSELAAALLAVGVTYLYYEVGLATIVLFGLVLITFQYLLGELLLSEQRAEELEQRNTQLASFQLGLMSALLHTLDLRDRMTARHSAAVARYSREIARAAGLPEGDQELVHTAALLHDIGKFIFPDRILKADVKLTDEDWRIIRMHPHQGAQIVADVEGYGPVGDIIVAHHERYDGSGYPRGLAGDDIPELSRIISVADTYDVLTARDSYRKPISSFEAIQELQRVAGTHLDARFVEVFVGVLAGTDLRYRHGEDADFDAELGLERRVHEYAVS